MKKMSTTAPEGYDQKLWESIPSVQAQLHPGKHKTYVFGQSSVDGTACVGCHWQTSKVLFGPAAVTAHDGVTGGSELSTKHDCSVWLWEKGACPCGKASEEAARNKIKAEALEEFRNKLVTGDYTLNFTSANDLFDHITRLLKRDANTLNGE